MNPKIKFCTILDELTLNSTSTRSPFLISHLTAIFSVIRYFSKMKILKIFLLAMANNNISNLSKKPIRENDRMEIYSVILKCK